MHYDQPKLIRWLIPALCVVAISAGTVAGLTGFRWKRAEETHQAEIDAAREESEKLRAQIVSLECELGRFPDLAPDRVYAIPFPKIPNASLGELMRGWIVHVPESQTIRLNYTSGDIPKVGFIKPRYQTVLAEGNHIISVRIFWDVEPDGSDAVLRQVIGKRTVPNYDQFQDLGPEGVEWAGRFISFAYWKNSLPLSTAVFSRGGELLVRDLPLESPLTLERERILFADSDQPVRRIPPVRNPSGVLPGILVWLESPLAD